MADEELYLDDTLTVSDLRDVDTWACRLSKAGELRLKRGGEVIGVLLSPDVWHELASQNARFEDALRLVENALDRKIIAEREGGTLSRGKLLGDALELELESGVNSDAFGR